MGVGYLLYSNRVYRERIMAKHLCERRHIGPRVVHSLLLTYNLNLDFLGDEGAKRYALFWCNRNQQTNHAENQVATARSWAFQTNPNYQPEHFERLIKQASGGPYNKIVLEGNPSTFQGACHDYVDETYRSSKLYKTKMRRMEQGLKNLKRLSRRNWTGPMDPCPLERSYVEHLLTWCSIKRGRDLFIPGMGGFNIREAFGYFSYSYGIPDVRAIQKCGYANNGRPYYLGLLLARKTSREYIAKWWQGYFKQDQSRLDEIETATRYDVELDLSVPPPIIYRRLQEALDSLHRSSDKELDYSWLDQSVDEETEYGTLKVLKAADQIRAVGKDMKNCAGSYVRDVANQKCLLVALYQGDKAVCLGMLGPSRYIPYNWTWRQIYASCNKKPKQEWKELFHKRSEKYGKLFK